MNNIRRDKRLTLGIVATIADAENSIAHFIEYHFAIGFSKIYLFIDDNNGITKEIASAYENVVCYPKDATLAIRWKNIIKNMDNPKWSFLNSELRVRQELNFYIAYQDAKKENVDWLLHLDINELFYTNNNDLQEHFANLQIQDYEEIVYLNYESIQTEINDPSIYLSSSHFKIDFYRKKHLTLNKDQIYFIENSNWLTIELFKSRSNQKSSINLFRYQHTSNDKSLVRSEKERKSATSRDPFILRFDCVNYPDLTKYDKLVNSSEVPTPKIHETGKITNKEDEVQRNKETIKYSEDQINILLEKKLAVKIDYHINLLASLKGNPNKKNPTSIKPIALPKISCLCITHKRHKQLKKSIECFLSQTYTNKELVVVCNHLDKNTQLLLRNINSNLIKTIILSDTQNLTLGDYRNIAINEASGEYICTWDDDDWSNTDRLELQINAAIRHKKPGSILSQILMLDTKNKIAYLSNQRMWENTVLIHKQTLIDHKISYMSYNLSEDYYFVNSLIDINALFPLNEALLYIYQYSGKNTSNENHFNTLFSRSCRLSDYHASVMMNAFKEEISVNESSTKIYGNEFSENVIYIPIINPRP